MKNIMILFMLAASVFALQIESPDQGTSFEQDYELLITANSTNITYEIDDETFDGCENCTEFSTDIMLEPGNHTITAFGDNESESIWVYVDDFSFDVDYSKDDQNVTAIAESDRELDIIEYKLNDDGWVTACENCSEAEVELELENGDYTLAVRGLLDILTKEGSFNFTIDEIGLEIISPAEADYDTRIINLEISTRQEADINYVLDGELTEACLDCTEFEDELNVSYGDHTLQVYAYVGEEFATDTIEFTVEHPEINLRILEPDAVETGPEIKLQFRTDTEVNLSYELDGQEYDACRNCSSFSDEIELDEGNYSLEVTAELDGKVDRESIDFEVKVDDKQDDFKDDDQEDERYFEGFNKLPQMFASGELTDEELADILTDNEVPPGIVNRLIKTGLLENESINAILDNQFNPPGILKKIIGFFGFYKSYSEQIHEKYQLGEQSQQKLLMRDDLPKNAKNEIKDKLQKKVQERSHGKSTAPGQAKKITKESDTVNSEVKNTGKSFNAGKQDFVPPGQAKKESKTAGKGNSGKNSHRGNSGKGR